MCVVVVVVVVLGEEEDGCRRPPEAVQAEALVVVPAGVQPVVGDDKRRPDLCVRACVCRYFFPSSCRSWTRRSFSSA